MANTVAAPEETTLATAAGLVPRLRANAQWAEENRRLHPDSLAALTEAGIFRLRVPLRYGGQEADTLTLVRVAAELGRGDSSAAWAAMVCWITTWMAGLFPDEVQDEVFAAPDTRVCGTLSPSAMGTPVPGGIVVNGKWGFISGALHSQWQVIIGILAAPEQQPMPFMALVPLAELTVVDDWHTSGLRGSGSVTTIAQDLFVPAARFIPLPMALQGGQHASLLNSRSPIYRVPLLPAASASSAGAALGMALAAKDCFFERLPERKITYTSYEHQNEAPLTHLQVADAVMKIDEARFHAERLAGLVDAKALSGEPFTLAERATARADMGATVRLAKQAVDILADASGGSSIYQAVAMQRIVRDIQAVSLHALMHPDTNAELFGRVLCGLEPNSIYI
jgi:alkylation response protein AidB-like acyl-CoA dehydrogenase